MEAAGTLSSKVTVQCTDPSNLLATFKSKFDSRNPLTNLHWKSPSGPLRSIPSLEVSLSQNESVHNGSRRHQIPGLRETPYVKLYLLRCDDKDTYRESVRKDIKQWIKENTLEKESKSALRNQEYHDAYEWMIVHVVLPNTPAASQPKSAKHLSLDASESTDSVNSKSKWTGKSPSTIYDKLRADFSSSKTSVSRVSQVRITEPGRLAGPLSAAEIEDQWTDLVSNLKEVVLKAFSTRVEQYEEDISERESQRVLPGWNFCTFFLLKEGLAREFESVGLHDDALEVYDEMDADLDALMNQGAFSNDFESSAGLLPYSRDLKAKLGPGADKASNNDSEPNLSEKGITLADLLTSSSQKRPFDSHRRHYQKLILTNQVSALDLHIYLFTRRLEIFLAKSRTSTTAQAKSRRQEPAMNLAILALLAEKSLDFITSAARQLRFDLTEAYGSGGQSILIDNLVASWTWMALMQILAIVKPGIEPYVSSLHGSKHSTEGNDSLGTFSARGLSSTLSSSPRVRAGGQKTKSAVNGGSETAQAPVREDQHLPSGATQLAAWTARLLLLSRDVLEGLPACRSWVDEYRKLGFLEAQTGVSHRRGLSSMTPIDYKKDQEGSEALLENLEPPTLAFAASSQESFRTAFKLCSEAALELSRVGGTLRTTGQILLDNAKLYYSWSKIDQATNCLRSLISLSEQEGVLQNQPQALALYARCLKESDNRSEYANCLLQCLQSTWLCKSGGVAQAYVDDLAAVADVVASRRLPLSMIAEVVDIGGYIWQSEDNDGFGIGMRIQSRIAANFAITSPMSLVLRSLERQELPEITLRSSAPVSISKTATEVLFESTVIASGWFQLSRLEVPMGQISFFQSLERGEGDNEMATNEKAPILVYPGPKTPLLELSPSPNAYLGKEQTVRLKVQAMDRDISRCRLRMRAATAGLRLLLHDAVALTDNLELEVMREKEATWHRFPSIAKGESAEIEVPFSLENPNETSILIKCELNYSSGEEQYTLYESCESEVHLPISVNVQDIYRGSHWFSRFHIGTSTLAPIVLLGCEVEERSNVKAKAHNIFDQGPITFAHLPAQWTIRLESLEGDSQVEKLELLVRYQCVDEIMVRSLEQALKEDLSAAGFTKYIRPVSKHLLQKTKSGWTEQDLEMAGLTHGLETWYQEDDVDMKKILRGLDGPTSRKLEAWLTDWHRRRNVIQLDASKAQTRTLKLTVELPAPPPIITAVLSITTGISSTGGVAKLGQPLLCELLMEKSLPFWIAQAETEFVFELFAQADTWLVGGSKKGHLSTKWPRTKSQVILIPQKTGSILLPVLDVRCRRRSEGEWEEVTIELNNRSASTTVMVSANVQSTTLALAGQG